MAVIEINNLGPINHCRMDLKKFCVLTGPQASGKSTIAKSNFLFPPPLRMIACHCTAEKSYREQKMGTCPTL